MIQLVSKSNCCGCHACKVICPQQCIKMVADEEGFLYPRIDQATCVSCGACTRVCPTLNKTAADRQPPLAYAAYHRDEKIRAVASSGGVFSALATHVLKNGGVVFGAAFDQELKLRTTYVETVEELPQLYGSKYVQSTLGDAYSKAKSFLEEKRTVLFTGTPCQIEGLYRYLGKEYDNLITQDIICHGVPSPKLFKMRFGNQRIKALSFRNKTNGWRQYSLELTFENGRQELIKSATDSYMKAFLKNFALRPSCYACPFKELTKRSDITLGDFWGIEKVRGTADDNKGTSLVLINSAKGKTAFDCISNQLIYEQVDAKAALRYNPSALCPSVMPKKRRAFWECVDKKGLESATKQYTKRRFLLRIKDKVVLKLKVLGAKR